MAQERPRASGRENTRPDKQRPSRAVQTIFVGPRK
nr:MAG TPA: hypothetical protein [Caudoviricetes sp.]